MKLLVIAQKVDKNDAILGFFVTWLKRLAKSFDQVIVITILKGTYQLPENVKVYSLGKELGKGKIARRFRFFKLAKDLLPQANLVLAHMCPEYIVALRPLNLFFKKPLFLWYTHKAVSKYLVKAEKQVKKIFTASKESCRLKSNKIIITGHGIDLDYFKPSEEKAKGHFEIISVGRMAPVKNHQVLLKALSQLNEKDRQQIKVKLIGEPLLVQDKEYFQELKLKTKDLGLDNLVEFIGPIPYQKILSYYQQADLLINLSKTGSIDKVVLEAMACGLLVLTSNEAFRRILLPKYLVKRDSSEELAQKILAFKKQPPNDDLRSKVFKDHDLDQLIRKISREMNNYV